MFSFLTQISKSVGELIDGLSDTTKRHIEDTPWYRDAIEISRVKNLEKFRFIGKGHIWTPFKSILCAILFNLLFKFRLGRLLSLGSTCAAACMIILGVQVQIFPDGPWTVLLSSAIPAPFLLAVAAFLWPLFCVSAGALIKFSTVRELNYNLRNLGNEAINDAEDLLQKAETAIKH